MPLCIYAIRAIKEKVTRNVKGRRGRGRSWSEEKEGRNDIITF